MTKIEWCDETWNPITGCTPISEGCTNCYARRMARRLGGRFGYPRYPNHFEVTFHQDRLDQPFKWKKARRIFVCSMGDLFHDDISFEKIAAIFGVAAFCQDHTFLFLTKRPERMAKFFSHFHNGDYSSNHNWWLSEACLKLPEKSTFGIRLRRKANKFPLPNVWLGVTAENQKRYEERWISASKIPATVKFVSLEPALEHIDIDIFAPWPDWVIWGPETGPGKRPFKNEWAESVFEQCQEKDIPFFDKRKNYLAREFPA